MARQPVGVDVTAHKERREAGDTRRAPKLRARFYVELVVGSRHASHTRVGFSGTFKALLALHRAFERAYADQHEAREPAGQRRASASSSSSSTASQSSASSAASSGVRRFFRRLVQPDRPAVDQAHRLSYSSSGGAAGLPPFPASNKLLVRIEGDAGKDDAKVEARAAALFEYYSQLFNSDDGDLFLDLVYQHAALAADKKKQALQEPSPEEEQHVRGIFKNLMARHDKDGVLVPSSTTVEFLEPVHVHKSKSHRASKRGSNQRNH